MRTARCGRLRSPALALLAILLGAGGAGASERIPVKVIVLCGFEVGDDTGDAPGEFQFWVEREKLFERIEVPGAPHPLCRNPEGLYADVGGNTRDPQLTPVTTSELVMALCLDPRFDLRRTYWLVNGISGIDPASGSIGSAVWSEYVVDGDALREVDEAEMPAGWPYGLFAIDADGPGKLPAQGGRAGGWNGAKLEYTMAYHLNGALARWACGVAGAVRLPDSPQLKAWREKYAGYPLAQLPPRVMMGDSLGSARYWHGARRTKWARDWVRAWTGGKGTFSTTSMEQQDYVGTLTRMAAKGFLDVNRVMLMRTASNYSMPPPGQGVETTIGDESVGTGAALESAYLAGSAVAHELLRHWDQYESRVPGGQ
jgi:purine nucleoside permease